MLNRLLRNGSGKRFGTHFVLAKYTNGVLTKADAADFGHSLRKYDRLKHKTEHLILEHQTAHVLLNGERGMATISDCYKLIKRDQTGRIFVVQKDHHPCVGLIAPLGPSRGVKESIQLPDFRNDARMIFVSLKSFR